MRPQLHRGDAVLQKIYLRLFRAFIAAQEKPVMQVVAPKRPVDEGERIIVLADLRRRDHYLWNRDGKNALRSNSGVAPRTSSAISFAVIGASNTPLRKCPLATK